MPRFTDSYGDTLDVELTSTGLVDININERTDEDKASAAVLLNEQDAAELGRKLLEYANQKVINVTDADANNMSFNEAMLRLAAIHKRTVCFRYQKVKGGYIESRRLNPTALVGERGSETHGVTGSDPDRDAPRRFRLSQIQGEVSFA